MTKRNMVNRLKNLQRRMLQLECKHEIEHRKFKIQVLHSGIFLHSQECNICGKSISYYADVKEYNKAEKEWHKQMVKFLEVKNDNT